MKGWLALPVVWLASGCVAHVLAGDPHPDFVARTRTTHTFRLDAASTDANEEVCASSVCVRGLRAEIEQGLRDTLGQMAVPAPPDAVADYVARLDRLAFGSARVGSGTELSLTWAFTVYDTRTGATVVGGADTETVMVPARDVYAERVAMLEHAMVAHVQALLDRSPLAEP